MFSKMTEEDNYKRLLEKVEKVTKEKKLDLSSDEDLSIGIMHLISIEEHLFFTAEKTGKKDYYYKLLNEVREIRKGLLKKIVKDYEGEVWCISKHLLGASMRLIEVGTKHLSKGDEKIAKEFFQKAFNLYSLFWALNLKIVDSKIIRDKGIISSEAIKNVQNEERGNYSKVNLDLKNSAEEKSFFLKIGNLVKKAINCCKE